MRGSWSRDDAHEVERQLFGQAVSGDWAAEKPAITAFETEHDRELFKLRAQLFETREDTTGLVYQELAQALLDRELVDQLPYQVACMALDNNEST